MPTQLVKMFLISSPQLALNVFALQNALDTTPFPKIPPKPWTAPFTESGAAPSTIWKRDAEKFATEYPKVEKQDPLV